ncbi:protein mono-ADP-ribosyltransferase TIPARP-like isoform X3 [Oculina patagonica]
MQNYRATVLSAWNKLRKSVYKTVNPIWYMLYLKVFHAGKRTKRHFDPLFTAYFNQRKIIQGKLDRLSNHSSAGYAMVAMMNFAAILLKISVAVECIYHFRPYYWMILYGIGREATTIVAVMGAIVKFMVIMTLRLTSRIFMGFTAIVVYSFSLLIPNALLALNGVFRVSKLLITPITSPAVVLRNDWKSILQMCLLCCVIVTLMLLWRRRVSTRVASTSGTSSTAATAVFPDSPLTPLSSGSPSMPYRWQFKEADSYQWRNFGPTDNVTIEKLYCDVENLGVGLFLKDTRSSSSRGLNVSTTVTVNFEQMSMHWLDTSAQFLLRRLSTPSYIQEPGNVLSTKWVWYWKDNDGWKKYAKTKQSTGTKQEDIEAAYLNEERIYFFQIGPSKYIITFYETSMYQRNMDPSYLTMRSVRRRPLFASQPALQTLQSDPTGKDMDFERIALGCGSREFQDASKRFHETIAKFGAKILVIEKIKNDFLLERYNRKREQMKKKLKASNNDEIEKLLFHGTTPDVIDAICKQNFDHRMRGKNGTGYGEGSYFAVNASYSNKYSSSQSGEKTRFMFLASVLTGEYKLSGRDLRRPPLKDLNNPASDLYDSCVDNEEDPKIFVIFNDEQCYPLFLIKFRLQ